MKIGLIQLRCEKGAIDQNRAAIVAAARQAERRGVEIVGFPEMSLTGYADPNRFPHAVIRVDGPEVARVLEETADLSATLLFGIIEANGARKPFITQVVARFGQLVGAYRKVTIADDEVAWFSPGHQVPLFVHDDLPFGVAICADIDNPGVFARAAEQGARIVFELAAPGLYGEQATRDWRSGYDWWEGECGEKLGAYARERGIWIAVATQAGRTVDEDFPGGGFLFDPRGARRFATADEKECAIWLDIDLDAGTVRELP